MTIKVNLFFIAILQELKGLHFSLKPSRGESNYPDEYLDSSPGQFLPERVHSSSVALLKSLDVRSYQNKKKINLKTYNTNDNTHKMQFLGTHCFSLYEKPSIAEPPSNTQAIPTHIFPSFYSNSIDSSVPSSGGRLAGWTGRKEEVRQQEERRRQAQTYHDLDGNGKKETENILLHHSLKILSCQATCALDLLSAMSSVFSPTPPHSVSPQAKPGGGLERRYLGSLFLGYIFLSYVQRSLVLGKWAIFQSPVLSSMNRPPEGVSYHLQFLSYYLNNLAFIIENL